MFSELKEALPARQLLACTDRGAGGGGDPSADDDALSVLKAGADVWVTGSSNPRESSPRAFYLLSVALS